MPPDVRDWVPSSHLVWTVLEVVEQVDTSGFHRLSRRGGAGRAGFDPDMLLAVLILGYCTGQRSSRQLERLCAQDVGFRVACANQVPDHTVLARFRQAHGQGFEELFAEVLVMAAVRGLVRLDTVAVDGTKIAANASLDANRDEQWVREQARKIVDEARATDEAEDELFGDARGDEPDPEMADPASRKQAVQEWLEELERVKRDRKRSGPARDEQVERRKREAAAGNPGRGRYAGTVDQRVEQARIAWQSAFNAQQGKVQAYARAKAAGVAVRGPAPVPADRHVGVGRLKTNFDRLLATAEAAAQQSGSSKPGRPARRFQVNTTDPSSRIMTTRRGWVQGYNVQLAVTGDQIIVACSVGQSNDMGQFVPMMTATEHARTLIEAATGSPHPVGTVLADAGYASRTNLTADGPDRLIALGKGRQLARRELADEPPPQTADPKVLMQHRLDTPDGRDLYKRRGATVEPAIGNLKKLINRFSQRGLAAATAETKLTAAAFNILKIHRTPALA
jgi:transposase